MKATVFECVEERHEGCGHRIQPESRKRSTPLAAARNFYPGFFGALFLVLLRIAIGWHFLNEGCEKVGPILKGEKGFSAEGYLRNSTGPLAPYFRGLVPDVNGLDRLYPDRLKKSWAVDVERIADHFGFDKDQRTKAKAELSHSNDIADAWFSDREKSEKRAKYLHELAQVQKIEHNRQALSYEKERAAARRKELDTDRADLLKELDGQGSALREAVSKLATDEQASSAGPYLAPKSTFERMNLFISFSVLAIGFCLLLGLFTRLAAVGGAVFLLQIYLSMPPWPGLPASPRAEGHYFIVDKNFVEMMACLALAFLPTGHWVGLDALLFGRRRHLKTLALAEPENGEHANTSGGSAPVRRVQRFS